jgi:hypothetical protein
MFTGVIIFPSVADLLPICSPEILIQNNIKHCRILCHILINIITNLSHNHTLKPFLSIKGIVKRIKGALYIAKIYFGTLQI